MRKQDCKVVGLPNRKNRKMLSWEDAIANDDVSGLPSENQSLMDAQTIMSLFFNEDWVFITADLIASEFSSPWPRVMDTEIIDGRAVSRPAEGHFLQKLLDEPSLYGDSKGFWYRAAIFDCLLGNSFFWYMRANQKLLIIPSHQVLINFDEKTKLPKEYIWTAGDTASGQKPGVSFPREEVLHVQRPNPASMWWGLSPFVPGKKSILFNRYSSEFLNSFFEKGATPQMIVETEIGNNKEQITALAKSFEIMNSGRRNHRRPLVLPKGAKVTQVNMTLADTKLYDFIMQNREVILNLLHVPKHAVGLQTAGSLGSEEHKTALRFMWQSAIKPMLLRYSTALTKFFISTGDLQAGYSIEFDTSDVELANDDMSKKADLANKLSGTHTINEIRQIIWESKPIAGGDIIPGVIDSETATSKVGEPSTAPATTDGEAITTPEISLNGAQVSSLLTVIMSVSSGQIPRESGVAILQTAFAISREAAENIMGTLGTTFTPAVAPVVEMALDVPQRTKYSKLQAIVEAPEYQQHCKSIDEEMIRVDENMMQLSVDTLISQTETAMRVIKEEQPMKMICRTKAVDEDELKAEVNAELKKGLPEWRVRYGNILEGTTDIGYKSQLSLVFNDKDRAALAALEQPTSRGRKAILARRGIDSFDAISKTTTDEIVGKIAKGVAEGATLADIARSIISDIPQRIFSRAKTITRTETLTAVSIGQQSAIKNAARVIPDAVKVWISAQDDRTRHSHEQLHGDTVDVNDKFVTDSGVKLSLPRDPSVGGHPEEMINCRCTVAIVAKEDRDTVPV
jgi:HK97 family phage portal protein